MKNEGAGIEGKQITLNVSSENGIYGWADENEKDHLGVAWSLMYGMMMVSDYSLGNRESLKNFLRW